MAVKRFHTSLFVGIINNLLPGAGTIDQLTPGDEINYMINHERLRMYWRTVTVKFSI